MGIILAILIIIALLAGGFWLLGAVASILWYLLVGLVIGALGRLVAPGARHMSLLRTSLYGVIGALLGGIIAEKADLGGLVQFVVSVIVAAVLVAFTAMRTDEV
jgi:uncharacterized membrane protein YeaQ/YmgE (transglycosylase-associated protein family)